MIIKTRVIKKDKFHIRKQQNEKTPNFEKTQQT